MKMYDVVLTPYGRAMVQFRVMIGNEERVAVTQTRELAPELDFTKRFWYLRFLDPKDIQAL